MRRIVIAIVVAACFALPAGAEFSLLGMKNSLIQFALSQISIPGELEITADRVEDAEDGATELVGIAVADGQGVWLTIERLSLRWNASRIIAGELEISRLAASGVDVLRAPAASAVDVEVREEAAIAQTDDDPFDWPRAPIAARIDELALADVSVAPGVIASQSLAFDATGAFRDEGDEQSLQLTVARNDVVAGRITLDFLRDFAAETLRLKLSAQEAPGGLVAELANLPNEAASVVRLDADGPLNDWRLSLDARTDGVFAASGSARFVAVGPLALSADFALTAGEALSEPVRAALSPEARLRVVAQEDDEGVIRIEAGSLRAADLDVEISGDFDRKTNAADLSAVIEARGGLSKLFEGIAFDRIRFDGAVTGPPEDLEAKGAIAVDGLMTSPADVGAARLDASLRIAGEAIEASASGRASSLRIDRLDPATLGDAQIELEAALLGDAATLTALNIAARPASLSLSGVGDLGAATANISYELSAPDLAPLAAAYQVDASGGIVATGGAEGPLSRLRLSGEAEMTDLRFDGRAFGGVLLTHNVVVGDRLEGEVLLAALGDPFGPASLMAVGVADFSAGTAMLDYDLTALNIEPLTEAFGQNAKGVLTAAGRAEGPLEAIRLSGRVDLENIALDGQSYGDLRLNHDATFDEEPDGRVELTAAGSPFGPASIDAAFALEAETLELQSIGAAVLGATVDGAIAIELPTSLAEGALTVSIPDLATLRSVAGAPVAGAAEGDIALSAVDGAQAIDAALSLRRLSASGLTVGSANASVQVRRVTSGDPAVVAKLTAGEVDLGFATLDQATLSANGALSRLAMDLGIKGQTSGEAVAIVSSASADLIAPARTIAVSTFEATLDATPVATLTAPMVIQARPGATTLSGLALAFPGGDLRGDAALFPGGASGDLTVEARDLAQLAEIVDLPISSGALSLAALFDTRRRSAMATINATASDLRFAEIVADIGALGADVDLNWDGEDVAATASVSGPFGEPLRARLSAPLRPSGGALPVLSATSALDGGLDWRGDIGSLWPLVPAPGHVLDGETNLALTLGGTIDEPEIGGDISISDGRYENLDIGTILLNLSATSSIAPDGGLVVDLSADDGSGDPVTARVEIDDGELDARLTADGATLVRRDDAQAAVSLDIAAVGPLTAPDISGSVRIDRAEIRLVNATPPGVADIGEIRVKGEEPKEPEPEAGEDVDLSIDVSGPRDIFVRGRGLDSEWGLELAIRGTAADPRIRGTIERRRGVLNLLGRVFELEEGLVRFTGAPGVDPTLNVQLMRENDGVTGGLSITGTAKAPEIAFTSRPALPEEEVLPRVLFGRSKQSLSPTEALSLGAGLATLLDGSGGAVDDLRGTIGVDTLRVEDGEDGPSITVGGNVADNVFVGVKQPIAGGSSSVQVEVEIFDDVTIDSEVGQDQGTSIGLNWKKDF